MTRTVCGSSPNDLPWMHLLQGDEPDGVHETPEATTGLWVAADGFVVEAMRSIGFALGSGGSTRVNRPAHRVPGTLPRMVDRLPDTLNCDQVAQLLGIHPQVARQMARQGRLPARRTAGMGVQPG